MIRDIMIAFLIFNAISRSSGLSQGLKQTAVWHFLLIMNSVTGRYLNPVLQHAAYQLLYLAEIRLIRETDKPINTQK